LRASDTDRNRTASLLREHHAQGRLTSAEFNDRLDRAFAAKTVGELDELLADLPGIDLYRLPSAGIRLAPHGTLRTRSGGSLVPARSGPWIAWAATSSLLFVLWVSVGAVSGGAAWLPWFLLISVPWAIALARRE
jgi:hypothetical protein